MKATVELFGSRVSGYALLSSDQDTCMVLPPASEINMSGDQLLHRMREILKDRRADFEFATQITDAIAAKSTLSLKIFGLKMDITYWHTGTKRHGAMATTALVSGLIRNLESEQQEAITLFVDWAKHNQVCVCNSPVRKRLKAVHWVMVIVLMLKVGLVQCKGCSAVDICYRFLAAIEQLSWSTTVFNVDEGSIDLRAAPDANATFRLICGGRNLIGHVPAALQTKINQEAASSLKDAQPEKYWEDRAEMWQFLSRLVKIQDLCDAYSKWLEMLPPAEPSAKSCYQPPLPTDAASPGLAATAGPMDKRSLDPERGDKSLAVRSMGLADTAGPESPPLKLRKTVTKTSADEPAVGSHPVLPLIAHGDHVWEMPDSKDRVHYTVYVRSATPKCIVVYLPSTCMEILTQDINAYLLRHLSTCAILVQPKLQDLATGKKKWKARPPRYLVSWIDSMQLAGMAQQPPLPLSVVGLSRGAFWCTQLACQLGYHGQGVASRFVMVGHYPEPGCTEDESKQAAASVRGMVFALSSRSDTSCPYCMSAPYLDTLSRDVCRIGHKVVVLEGVSHEALGKVVTGQLQDNRGLVLTQDLWRFALFDPETGANAWSL